MCRNLVKSNQSMRFENSADLVPQSRRGPLLVAGCRSGAYLSKMVSQKCVTLLKDAHSHEQLVELEDIGVLSANLKNL